MRIRISAPKPMPISSEVMPSSNCWVAVPFISTVSPAARPSSATASICARVVSVMSDDASTAKDVPNCATVDEELMGEVACASAAASAALLPKVRSWKVWDSSLSRPGDCSVPYETNGLTIESGLSTASTFLRSTTMSSMARWYRGSVSVEPWGRPNHVGDADVGAERRLAGEALDHEVLRLLRGGDARDGERFRRGFGQQRCADTESDEDENPDRDRLETVLVRPASESVHMCCHVRAPCGMRRPGRSEAGRDAPRPADIWSKADSSTVDRTGGMDPPDACAARSLRATKYSRATRAVVIAVWTTRCGYIASARWPRRS